VKPSSYSPTPAKSGLAILFTTLALVGCDSGKGGGDGHDDHGPPGASSNQVSLSADQVEAAGIRSQVAGPGKIVQRLRLTAVVHENEDAQAHLTPRVPGLVKSIRKRLGDRVKANDVVCEIESTELGKAASAYMEASASLLAARQMLTQETALLERGVQVATTILKREEKLKDQEITTLRPFYEAQKALAQSRLNRDSRVLVLRGEVTQRRIQLHTAEEGLRILGLSDKDLEGLTKDTEHGHGRYLLKAPRAGVIVARDVTENEFVDTSSKLFQIQDLSRVWVIAGVYEQDLKKVERGQTAEVRLEAFPGVTLKGEVTLIDYRVDPVSRACKVRVELPNKPIPGWKEPLPLRPGLFGTVDLVLAEQDVAVAVPEQAIVHEGEQTFVFVALGADTETHEEKGEGHEGESSKGHEEHDDHKGHDDHEGHDDESPKQRFERREVVIGASSGSEVEIKSGVKAGDRVVTVGTFTLKSAARQGELGGGHSH